MIGCARTLVLGLSLAALVACAPERLPRANSVLPLAMNGVASADVVVAADASPCEKHAASELAAFLGEVTGGVFPIRPEPGAMRLHLLVGTGAAKHAGSRSSVGDLAPEEILVHGSGDSILLLGGSPRGTLYAVYTFLEEFAGCRWWSSDASTIPRHPDLAVPRGLDVRYRPPLEYRWPFWTHINRDADLAARNKVNGPSTLRAPQYGGNMSHGGVHTFYVLLPPEEYFDAHPEWFSEIDGKRTGKRAQLCLSNEAMRRELVRRLAAQIRGQPDPPVYSVSQNDWAGYCTCARCAEIAARYGGQSGLMLWFVNQVAEAIEKEFPRASVSTLAYQYTRSAPVDIRPRANVIVQLCSIESSFSVPFEHERNRAFRDDVAAWGKIADRLYVWDYVTNFRHHFLPHPNLRVLGPNIRFLVANNVRGIFEQGAYTTPGAEFAELRGWVLAKLLWDPALDETRLLEEFVAGYYGGAAAPHILRYIDLMHEAVAASGDSLGCFAPSEQAFLSFETLGLGWESLRAAEAAVAGDPACLERVKAAELPVRLAFILNWRTLRDRCRATGATWPMPAKIRDAADEFRRIAVANGVTRLDEWHDGFGQLDEALASFAEEASTGR